MSLRGRVGACAGLLYTACSGAAHQAPVDVWGPEVPPEDAERVAFPLPREEARADIGRVVLTQARGRRAAERVARAFMSAVARESTVELGALVADGAELARANLGASEPLTRVWKARFHRFEYTPALVSHLAGAHLQVFSLEDLNGLAELRHQLLPASSEWLAVVRFGDGSREAGLGAKVELLIAPGAGGHRIVRAFEHAQLR